MAKVVFYLGMLLLATCNDWVIVGNPHRDQLSFQ